MLQRVWPVRQFELPKPVLSSDATVYRSAPVTASEIEAGVGLLAKRAQPTLADAYAHDTFSTHTMTQVNVTHAAGLLGKGIKIGVIDSGVDYTNSILGGCFGPGCHVSFGYDLVGDAYSGSNTPVPGGAKGPFTDCNEHGTSLFRLDDADEQARMSLASLVRSRTRTASRASLPRPRLECIAYVRSRRFPPR